MLRFARTKPIFILSSNMQEQKKTMLLVFILFFFSSFSHTIIICSRIKYTQNELLARLKIFTNCSTQHTHAHI